MIGPQGRQVTVVDHQRGVAPGDVGDGPGHDVPSLGVEAGQWLVEEQDRGVPHRPPLAQGATAAPGPFEVAARQVDALRDGAVDPLGGERHQPGHGNCGAEDARAIESLLHKKNTSWGKKFKLVTRHELKKNYPARFTHNHD